MKKLNSYGRVTLAALLAVSTFVALGGFYLFVRPAEAARITSVRDTLSTSTPSADANHTIQFVLQTLVNENDTIVLDFDTIGTADEFDLSGVAEAAGASDFDLAEDTDATPGNCTGTLTDETLDATATATTWGVSVNTTTDTITFTAPSNAATYLAAGACVVIEIGTNATSEFAGANQINNTGKGADPVGTAHVSDVAITFTGSAAADSGSALVAIIEGVAVSAAIAESLSFVIAGQSEADCETTAPTWPNYAYATTVNANTITYPTLTTETFYHACQTLTVTTNAGTGYNVTAQENTSLLSGTDTIDDTLCDGGACSETAPDDWTTATNNGFGISCKNQTGTPCSTDFTTPAGSCAAAPCYKQIACRGTDAQCDGGTGNEAAQTVLTGTSPVNGVVGEVEYLISADAIQPAGSYSNTVTWIATGTF